MPATIVLITGANQGIGYFAALQLAQLPGYHVLAGSRDVAKGVEAVKKIKAEGVRSAVETIQLDVDLDASIDAAVNLIAKRFGKLDALVNNAGHTTDDLLASGSVTFRDNLLQTYSTNVFGAAYLTERALPLLAKSACPRVVNVSSFVGSLTVMSDLNGPAAHCRFLAYNTSKSALNSVTAHYAYILHQQSPCSLVIALCPGHNATRSSKYPGGQHPMMGGNGIVAAITQGPDTTWKTGEFRDQFGKTLPW